jgi:hypothetical protein
MLLSGASSQGPLQADLGKLCELRRRRARGRNENFRVFDASLCILVVELYCAVWKAGELSVHGRAERG